MTDRSSDPALSPEDFKPERRREPRTACGRTIELLPDRASKNWGFISAELTDCSPRGLGLIARNPMPLDQQFLVKLRVGGVGGVGGGIKMLLYTVRSCTPLPKSRYRISAQFTGFAVQQMDGEEDAQAILDALLRGAD